MIPIVLIILFILINIYFWIAKKYDIIDVPNNRSSHISPTIRGGGIIIPVAVLLYYIIYGFQSSFFVLGLMLISTISLIDDIKTLSNVPRVFIQIVAVVLLLFQLDLYVHQWWVILAIFILVIGTINAVNFMDGINGITVAYAMTFIMTVLFVDIHIVSFTDDSLLISILIGLLVFGWFNFRKNAHCFAGDVGSVSVAFILCYLIIGLIVVSEDISFVLFLSVYGIDSVFTIMQRLWRRENIFKAHRLHLFQYLVNEWKYPHLLVASLYAILQLTINALVVYNFQHHIISSWGLLSSLLIVLGGVYIVVKWKIHHKYYT